MGGATAKSHMGYGSESDGTNQGFAQHANTNLYVPNSNTRREQQRLADIANSVSGFYKEDPHGREMSDHGGSNMSRTQDNFASNLVGNQRRSGQNGRDEEDRIYGSAARRQRLAAPESRGEEAFGDDLSDWER